MKVLGLLLLSVALSAQMTLDVKVESTVDSKTDFKTLHTYKWVPGIEATRTDLHKMIVAAVDAEMAKSGLTINNTAPDVTLEYYTVASTYVDFKALEQMKKDGKAGPAPTNTVGRLVLGMRRRVGTDTIWTASTREYIDPDPAKLPATVKSVAARLFDSYPTRTPAKK